MTNSYGDKISSHLERPGLARDERHLCWIVQLVSLGDMKSLREAIVSALTDDLEPETIREAILQSYLFVGYPRVINGLFLLKELCEERGLAYPSGVIADEDYPGWSVWEERGEDLCRKIYGTSYDRLQESIGDLHPLLARWMVVEGYGKVLSRDGMSARLREMLVISVLTSQGVWRQLRSHILGGSNLGITAEETREIIVQSTPFLPVEQIRRALGLLDDLIHREVRD